MNGFDLAILTLTGVLALVGLLQGLVRVLVGLAALVVAFLLASQFHRPLADALVGARPASPVLRAVAYFVIFLGAVLGGALVAFLLRHLVKAAMLGWADRLAGAALGVVAAALAVALVLLPVVAYTPKGERLLQDSVLLPYLTAITDVVSWLVPEDLAQRYRERVRELRRQVVQRPALDLRG